MSYRSFHQFWILVHRYTNLVIAAFLVVIAITGSLLAVRGDIDRLIHPHDYAKPQPDEARLDFLTITDKVEAQIPQAQVWWIQSLPYQVRAIVSPRTDPATNKPFPLGFDSVVLNPWTGEELYREHMGQHGTLALRDFLINIHEELFMGNTGFFIVGVIAIIWTIDCFVGFYLTLPATLQRFWPRWRCAWLIKWSANAARINFDLHRAGGLWVWPILFVFAWSGVLMTMPKVYHSVSDRILEYRELPQEYMPMELNSNNYVPRIDFRAALALGPKLMAERAKVHGFTCGQPSVIQYAPEGHQYYYSVRSSRDISDSDNSPMTFVNFNSDTGALTAEYTPTGEHAGNTVWIWLISLHMGWVFGLTYRIFIFIVGLGIAMLSYTGVYIWWKKRRVRIETARKQKASLLRSASQPQGITL